MSWGEGGVVGVLNWTFSELGSGDFGEVVF